MKENNAKCSICGKEFYRKPSLLKRAKNPTCSNECRKKVYEVKRIIVKCSVCGKNIETTESRKSIRKNMVCSNECKKKLLSNIKSKEMIELDCPICKKTFKVHPYRMKSCNSITCSVSCASKLQLLDKKNHPMYNENITDDERIDRRKLKENVQWRNSVLEKDVYTCDICGSYGGKLNAHHLNGYHWDKENRLNVNNGITLCSDCHKDFHKTYGNKNNTKEQYIEYANLNRRLVLKD